MRVAEVHGWAARLRSEGFVRVPGFIDKDLAQRVRRDLDALAKPKAAGSRDRTVRLDDLAVPSIREVATDGRLDRLAEAVCGTGTQRRVVKGSARAAREGELSAHTDIGPYVASPFPRACQWLTVHVICESVSSADGPTFFIPGTHKRLCEPSAEEASSGQRTWIAATAGDAVAWLGETWHGRLERLSDGERISLFLMYASSDVPSRSRARPDQ